MSLRGYRVSPQIAVSDMDRAREFYEGTLGLSGEQGPSAATWVYACGDGASLHLYAAPAHAGKATATVARWEVDSLDSVVEELSAGGVEFERYAEPVKTDARGVHDSGYGKVAWFRDPDGNTFALEQA
jgi:catechol 2,3-dioxygenase-like lactoylglutathione lyase family enzyme